MDLQTYLDTSGVTQAELARRLGVTPPMIWQWINRVRPVAAEKVIPLETATDGACPRYETRPDIYPPAEYRVEA